MWLLLVFIPVPGLVTWFDHTVRKMYMSYKLPPFVDGWRAIRTSQRADAAWMCQSCPGERQCCKKALPSAQHTLCTQSPGKFRHLHNTLLCYVRCLSCFALKLPCPTPLLSLLPLYTASFQNFSNCWEVSVDISLFSSKQCDLPCWYNILIWRPWCCCIIPVTCFGVVCKVARCIYP